MTAANSCGLKRKFPLLTFRIERDRVFFVMNNFWITNFMYGHSCLVGTDAIFFRTLAKVMYR